MLLIRITIVDVPATIVLLIKKLKKGTVFNPTVKFSTVQGPEKSNSGFAKISELCKKAALRDHTIGIVNMIAISVRTK